MMRDRLIELLKQIDFDYGEECVLASEDGYKCAPDFAEFFADKLIENGMIIPSVRVGQTVYRTKGNFGNVKIHKGFIDCIIIEHDKMWFYVYGHPLHFTEDDLGVNVFLTYEQAEKALAEVANEQH